MLHPIFQAINNTVCPPRDTIDVVLKQRVDEPKPKPNGRAINVVYVDEAFSNQQQHVLNNYAPEDVLMGTYPD